MMGESTKRSQLDADQLTEVIRQAGVAQLAEAKALTLVLDGMELRRAGAQAQEHLMWVKDLDGKWVNGYRSFNVLGMGEGEERGLLYHRLFSSEAPGFVSENEEILQALAQTETALASLAVEKTWVMDRGFDNDLIWWWVWDHTQSHVVWRVKHMGRIVLWQTPEGEWQERYLEVTLAHARPLATLETTLEVQLHGQKRAKRQAVIVDLAAVPLQVYAPQDKKRTKAVWALQVTVRQAKSDPWILLTDWPIVDEASAVQVFRFYRRRWAVEETFKFVKTAFGIEQVQMLKLHAVRTLVAMAWVAAGYLFHLGLTLEQPEIHLLARLGGWDERPNRPPGKLILTRGLRRLLDHLAIQAILHDHLEHHGHFPPFLQRLLGST